MSLSAADYYICPRILRRILAEGKRWEGLLGRPLSDLGGHEVVGVWSVTPLGTCSSPRHPLFLHALSFECTSKLCGTFLNLFLVYFHI